MIYIIQECDPPYRIKVGFSDNVEERVAALAAVLPQEIRLLRVMEGDRDDEKWLHFKLKEWRVEGTKEWYFPEPSLLDLLDDGTLDAAC